MQKLMLRTVFSLSVGLLLLGTQLVQGQTKWMLDKSHAGVKFTIEHLTISEVEGKFKSFDGSLAAAKPDFEDAQISFNVDVASIDTDNSMRDDHLKAEDYFNHPKFPKITFTSTSFKKKSGKLYELEGNLTMKGVTKKVKWQVMHAGVVKDPMSKTGGQKAGFKATTTVKRTDFGVGAAGGAMLGEDVNITVNLEFSQG
jgi:polyisoprenoid-binding protein YceI